MGIFGDYPNLEGQTVVPTSVDSLWGVWDRLIAQDVTGKPQPMLAEAWDVTPDYSQFTLHLRKGVLFHTGREMTSDDVKFCLQRLQDPKAASSLLGRAQPMASWETPDPYTVIVKASRPWPDAFDLFQYVNVIDPVTFQSNGLSKPTGTGPFTFAEYQQGDHLKLVKYPKYWQAGKPYLDGIAVTIFNDVQGAMVQLESGAIDMVDLSPTTDTLRLKSNPAYQVLANATTGAFWPVVVNTTRAPMDDKRVRQALNYALDRQRIADTIWQGLAQPEALPWSPSSPAYDETKSKQYAFNLDKAKALLAEAGVANAQLDIGWSASAPDQTKLAQIYQADLAKIGITVTLKPLEPANFNAQLRSGGFPGLMLASGLNGHLAPGSLILGPYYGPQVNNSGFTSNDYTQLSNQVLAAVDPAQQKTLYGQLNDYFLDQSWVIPVTQNPPKLLARANVRGLRFDGREALPLQELWLAA